MAAAAITLRCGAGRAPRAFRLCVLDCDGIIFNSNRLKTDAYRATLREIGAFCRSGVLCDIVWHRYTKGGGDNTL